MDDITARTLIVVGAGLCASSLLPPLDKKGKKTDTSKPNKLGLIISGVILLVVVISKIFPEIL